MECRNGTVLLLTALILLMGLGCTPKGDGTRHTDSALDSFPVGSLKWPPGAQVAFTFDRDIPVEFQQACMSAGMTINDALGVEAIVFSRRLGEYSMGLDGINLISAGKKPVPPRQGHQAVTDIKSVEGRILEADIDFDTRSGSFSEEASPGTADIESVCLHELGHALGLPHSQNPNSVMYPALRLGILRRNFIELDRENLRVAFVIIPNT